jgi:hypothetical protein
MLRPRLLTVGHGAVWVCDERLPVVVRVDRITGQVLGLASWPIDDALREQSSIADIDAGGDAVWVAAPSAGGLVRLPPDLKDEPHVIAIDAPVGSVSAHGLRCWAREESHGGEPDGSLGPMIWRVTSADVTTVDLGGFVWQIEATASGALALMQRPARTHVEQPHPSGGASWFYPGVLVQAREDGLVEEVMDLEDIGPRMLLTFDNRAWMRDARRMAPEWLAQVDLTRGSLGGRISLPSPALGIVVDGRCAWVHTIERRHVASWDRQEAFVRVPLGNGEHRKPDRAVVRGNVFHFAADADFLWASRDANARGEQPPVRIDADTLEVIDWPLDVDLTSFLPAARPPEGVDPAAHADEQRRYLEGSQVEGVTFDRVFVDGAFPDAELIVHFHSRHRRGITFGRRWRLFDDYGVPQHLDLITIEMEEDVLAAGHGLPPIDRCLPDDQGVVWF